MTFMLALNHSVPKKEPPWNCYEKNEGSRNAFLSLFSPPEILSLAKEAGFKKAEYVSGEDIYQRYFANRSDGLRAGNAEAFLVAGC